MLIVIPFFLVFAGAGVFLCISAAQPPPPHPSGVPADVRATGSLSDEYQGAIAVPDTQNQDFKIKIVFSGIDAINGLWNATETEFRITSPYQTTYPTESEHGSWGKMIEDHGSQTVQPWLSVGLPIEQKYLHHWVYATAKIHASYPYEQSGGWVFKESVQTRDVKLFVVSPDEYSKLRDYETWHIIAGGGPWGGYFMIAIGLAILGIGSKSAWDEYQRTKPH